MTVGECVLCGKIRKCSPKESALPSACSVLSERLSAGGLRAMSWSL